MIHQNGMELNQIVMRVVVRKDKDMVRNCMLFGLILWLLSAHALAQTPAPGGSAPHPMSGAISVAISASAGHDPMVDAAFDHFYNMEYDRAIQEFEKVLDRHPNDPAAINHLLTTVLLRELYKMGAMNTGEYANDSFIGQAHRPADPRVKAWIKQLVDRA